jgi:RHS repeat-associated protein
MPGTVIASFVYDGFGRRLATTAGGVATSYLYDKSGDVLEELNGATIAANLLNGLGTDERYVRAVTSSGTTSSFIADAQGSSVALTDTTATVRTSYAFDPYGNTSVSGTANSNTYQYTGRENDASAFATGLYYYRNRYYSPAWGRFISEDPLKFAGGDYNLYRYALGNPVMGIDPYGLWQITAYGGADFGFYITVGNNFGQWNVGIWIGEGAGLSVRGISTDTGALQTPGLRGSFRGAASLSQGIRGTSVGGQVGMDGSWGSLTGTYAPGLWGSGVSGSINSSGATSYGPSMGQSFGGGAAIFLGTGATWYSDITPVVVKPITITPLQILPLNNYCGS